MKESGGMNDGAGLRHITFDGGGEAVGMKLDSILCEDCWGREKLTGKGWEWVMLCGNY